MINERYAPAVQSAPAGTGATTIIPASGNATEFRDLVALVITTINAAASTLTISDGTKTRFVLNYPNAALAPGAPMVIGLPVPLEQTLANAAWTLTPSANASGYNVTAVYTER